MKLITKIAEKKVQRRQIFTFFVEDMMFDLNVENVLFLSQQVIDIKMINVEWSGFCGVTKFQGAIVPVLDFAHPLGIPSGIDAKTTLLAVLNGRTTTLCRLQTLFYRARDQIKSSMRQVLLFITLDRKTPRYATP
jgi:chemotaxis signal transduction protein